MHDKRLPNTEPRLLELFTRLVAKFSFPIRRVLCGPGEGASPRLFNGASEILAARALSGDGAETLDLGVHGSSSSFW